MRVETKQVTYYTLAELKEHRPNGFERALDMLRTDMWDGGHVREDVANSIAYKFGEAVGDGTVERYGEGDYPGVAGVTLQSWAVQARDAHVGFAGTLTPESAPGLPWDAWIEQVDLTATRSGTSISVVDSEDAPYLGWRGIPEPGNADHARLVEARKEMHDAVWEALNEALTAGEESAEAYETEEYLLETAAANEWEFDQNGDWA